MQTVISMAKRLDMTAEQAVEKLNYMLFDVSDVKSEIDDAQCDLLIDIDDDDSVADRVRQERLNAEEKKKKQLENLKKASQKAAAKRKASAKTPLSS